MLIKTRGICLHAAKYAETSVIAQVYTEAKGLQSYIISGVRTRKPKVHPSLLQPTSMLDLVAYWRPDATLFRTKEIRSGLNYRRIPFELPRSSVALFAAEVLLKALRESEAQAELFDFAVDFLVHLDTVDAGLGHLPAFFLMRITEFLGFQPELPDFGGPYYFDQSQGYFLPEAPDHAHYADADVSAYLLGLAEADLAGLDALRASRQVRNQSVLVLLAYLRHQVPRFTGIQSHRVLADVLR